MSRALSRFARAATTLWFRRCRAEGPLPGPGPALFLLNHPNGLLDPLVATALLDPPPRALAKATLWKQPMLRPFLALFDPIPVHRPKDGDASPEATLKTFQTVHDALAKGQRIALFPEGVSHGEADLAPLKTGAARMALSCPVPAALIPAGLVYGERTLFRSSVLLRLGEPIPYEDLRPKGTDPDAVLELTGRIREALYTLTLHDPEEERLRLAQDLAWLLAEGPAERADLERIRARVRTLLPVLAGLSERGRSRLARRVRAAHRWLRRSGLRPDQVGHPYPFQEVAAWVPSAAMRLALAPLLLPFGLLFWPPYRLVGWAVARLTDEIDQTATFKVLGGLLFFLLWTGGLGWLLHRAFGGWGLAGLAPLGLLLAFLALRLSERLHEDWQAIRGFARRGAPAAAKLLEARRMLIEAFPALEG
ncbi:MAG TPA: 1-acyl-sn-glycerol-3-phosphate acyltransferase [Holophagaceae bacterium]|nr:1-acyl-sn-glycerol-3-phosphate acyltransferase [Holophagaceae bacterium]